MNKDYDDDMEKITSMLPKVLPLYLWVSFVDACYGLLDKAVFEDQLEQLEKDRKIDPKIRKVLLKRVEWLKKMRNNGETISVYRSMALRELSITIV